MANTMVTTSIGCLLMDFTVALAFQLLCLRESNWAVRHAILSFVLNLQDEWPYQARHKNSEGNMARKKKFLVVQTFNPYEARYPGRKVISRDALHLVKQLRAQNMDVIILPDDGQPIGYLFRKGMLEFLRDPVIAFFVGVPVSIACNLMSNAIQYAWAKFQDAVVPGRPPDLTNIIFRTDGDERFFSYSGRPLGRGSVERLLESVNQSNRDYITAITTVSPYPNLRVPLFREHVPHVIGWCEIGMHDGSLAAYDAKITDPITLAMVEAGELRGMSVAGIAMKSICSICNQDYVACEHLTGEKYGDKECLNNIKEALLADVSLVREPVNTHAFLRIAEKADVAAPSAETSAADKPVE